MMQLGAMQDWKLRVTNLIDHAAREHGAREIVSRWADGSLSRTNWAGIRHDAMRMAQKLLVSRKPADCSNFQVTSGSIIGDGKIC
jgi:fatty-acyl-CoA synthase